MVNCNRNEMTMLEMLCVNMCFFTMLETLRVCVCIFKIDELEDDVSLHMI
jgi:hypothetical protein